MIEFKPDCREGFGEANFSPGETDAALCHEILQAPSA